MHTFVELLRLFLSEINLCEFSVLVFLTEFELFLACFCTTLTVAVTLGLVVDNLLLTGAAFTGASSDSDEYIAEPFFKLICFEGATFFSSTFLGLAVLLTGFTLFDTFLSFSGEDLLLLFCDDDDSSESENEESLPDELDDEEDELELLVDDDSELLALCYKKKVTNIFNKIIILRNC